MLMIKSVVLKCILLQHMLIVMKHTIDNSYSFYSKPLLQRRKSMNLFVSTRCVCLWGGCVYVCVCVYKGLDRLKLVTLLNCASHTYPSTGIGNGQNICKLICNKGFTLNYKQNIYFLRLLILHLLSSGSLFTTILLLSSFCAVVTA